MKTIIVRNRLLPLPLIAAFGLMMTPVLQAQFTYQTNVGTIYISRYGGPGGDVTIPDTINGLPIVGLDLGAFYNCTNLTAVTIADSITYIGDFVFYGCSNLTSVTIPNKVNTIGNNAFDSCVRLTNLTLGTNLATIGMNAFQSCYNLTSVIIPSSVTSLASLAFDCGAKLTSVYFEGNPPSVDTLDLPAFFGDDNVTIYYLPGTMGWTNTFPGLPTALWKPQVLTTAASFRVLTNQFGINVTWASGMTVVVEASTDLSHPTWFTVTTNVLSSGTFSFGDPQWTNYPSRFYRVRSP
jgi:hypothetical protein